jgi:predicted Zn-dependent peptidase
LPSKRQFEELSLEDVLAYRAKTFVSSNLVVTGSGISAANLKVLLETYLHELPKGSKTVVVSPYLGGDVRLKADLEGSTYIGLAFPTPAGATGSTICSFLSRSTSCFNS